MHGYPSLQLKGLLQFPGNSEQSFPHCEVEHYLLQGCMTAKHRTLHLTAKPPLRSASTKCCKTSILAQGAALPAALGHEARQLPACGEGRLSEPSSESHLTKL